MNKLELPNDILEILNENNITSIEQLKNLKRKDLLLLNLNNSQVKEIRIKLQLLGLDIKK